MSIPLVQNNEKDSINTSIIAIKRNIERINMLLGLSNSEEIDTSEFVKKSDIVDVVQTDNMNPVTSNAVATSNAMPVDTVTSGDMHSVTSNAVYGAISKFGNVINAVFRTPTNAIPIDASNLDLCSLTLPRGRWLLSISTRVDINGATESCLFGGFSLDKGGMSDAFIAVDTTDGIHFKINDTRVVDITTDNTVYYWKFYNLGLNNVSTINLTGIKNCVAIRLQ